MGLFGPSMSEKIRRKAATAFPQANWEMAVDWSTGSKLHKLHGSLSENNTEAQNMQFARDVWTAICAEYRLHPDDGRDGLLDVSVASPGRSVQRTGVQG